MNERMNERMNEWMNEWTNEWTNEWRNEITDGKYISTWNNVISDTVVMAWENYDMTKDMIEEWIHR